MASTARYLAITREISPAIEQCELTHLERTTIDLVRARAEHELYEAALRALGCEIVRLAAGPDMPDSVFIEDMAVVLDELAVITRPGAASRRVETAAVAAALRSHILGLLRLVDVCRLQIRRRSEVVDLQASRLQLSLSATGGIT